MRKANWDEKLQILSKDNPNEKDKMVWQDFGIFGSTIISVRLVRGILSAIRIYIRFEEDL